MKLECYLDPIVIQVVMQLEVKQHCRCTCIVAAVGYCAERAKDGTPHISRMVTWGSRQWWFDGFVFAVAHGFSVVCLATVVTDCAIDVAVGAVFIEGALRVFILSCWAWWYWLKAASTPWVCNRCPSDHLSAFFPSTN